MYDVDGSEIVKLAFKSRLRLFELGGRAGIHPVKLSHLVHGRRQARKEALERLASVLGVDWHTLVVKKEQVA